MSRDEVFSTMGVEIVQVSATRLSNSFVYMDDVSKSISRGSRQLKSSLPLEERATEDSDPTSNTISIGSDDYHGASSIPCSLESSSIQTPNRKRTSQGSHRQRLKGSCTISGDNGSIGYGSSAPLESENSYSSHPGYPLTIPGVNGNNRKSSSSSSNSPKEEDTRTASTATLPPTSQRFLSPSSSILPSTSNSNVISSTRTAIIGNNSR